MWKCTMNNFIYSWIFFIVEIIYIHVLELFVDVKLCGFFTIKLSSWLFEYVTLHFLNFIKTEFSYSLNETEMFHLTNIKIFLI